MKIYDFAEKYDLDVYSVYSSISMGQIPSIAIKREDGTRNEIDENFFLRRKQFDRSVQLFNHDVYYYLSEFFSDSDIARAVTKRYGGNYINYQVYLNNAMFEPRPDTIMQYKVPENAIKFYRFGRLILRYLRKRNKGLVYVLNRKGKNFSIGYLLDLRMK